MGNGRLALSKSIAANAVYKSILNICNIVIPVIVGPYILRVLDRGSYDLYNGTDAVFQVFLVLGAFGLYNYGVREISRIRDDVRECNRFFTEVFVIGLVTNVIAVALFLVYSHFFTEGLQTVLCGILALSFLSNVFNVEWINEANENYSFIAVKSAAVRFLYLILVLLLVKHSDDIDVYVMILVATNVLNMLVSFLYIKRSYSFCFRSLKLTRHLSPLLSTLLIVNIMIFYAQINKVALAAFVGDDHVTAFQISQYISSMIYGLVITLMTVSIPRLSFMIASGDKAACDSLHGKAASAFFMFMIPLTVGGIALSREMILLYGGNQYSDCIQPLMLYMVIQLVSSVHYILGDAYIYINGKEKHLLVINSFGALINVSISAGLIASSLYSALSAEFALLVAYFGVVFLDMMYVRKHLFYRFSLFTKQTALYFVASLTFVPIVAVVKAMASSIVVVSIVSVVACAVLYYFILMRFRDDNVIEFRSAVISRFKLRRG